MGAGEKIQRTLAKKVVAHQRFDAAEPEYADDGGRHDGPDAEELDPHVGGVRQQSLSGREVVVRVTEPGDLDYTVADDDITRVAGCGCLGTALGTEDCRRQLVSKLPDRLPTRRICDRYMGIIGEGK